jgi:hypothetical protein
MEMPLHCNGVVAVPSVGTNYKLMEARSRELASHALRLLRIGLREHNSILDMQLQFEFGEIYAFGNGARGAKRTLPGGLDLTSDLVQLINKQRLSSVTADSPSDVDQKVRVALRWIDKAMRCRDDTEATVWLMVALEAILGNKSERMKAHGLVFRRTMLGHLVTGHFPPPSVAYALYDQARSGTVHGEEPLQLPRGTVHNLNRSLRWAVNEFVTFAADEGTTKQSQLLTKLNNHEDTPKIVDWLRQHDPEVWADFKP